MEQPDQIKRSWSVQAESTPTGATAEPWSRSEIFSRGVVSTELFGLSLRAIAKRVREKSNDRPATWEIALYVRFGVRGDEVRAQREAATSVIDGFQHRWRRFGTWELQEPESLPNKTFGLGLEPVEAGSRMGFRAKHRVAQAACRISSYTPAEWIQSLPDADKLPIDGRPWVVFDSEPQTDLRRLCLRPLSKNPKLLEISSVDGPDSFTFHWAHEPNRRGTPGQGLYHLLLVTRIVRTAEGGESEAFVGIYERVMSAQGRKGESSDATKQPLLLRRLGGVRPVHTDYPPGDLRGYVLLMQLNQSKLALSAKVQRGEAPLEMPGTEEDLSRWLYPELGSGTPQEPGQTVDADIRMIGVSYTPIRGTALS